MNLSTLVKQLRALNTKHDKRLFTLREMATFAGESTAATGMTLLRAKRNGLVERVGRWWFSTADVPDVETLALAMRSPSYISFESALYARGVLSQSPRGRLMVAVRGRPARIATSRCAIEYIHLADHIFGGFDCERIAEGEKAMADLLYIRARRGHTLAGETWYMDRLKTTRVLRWIRRYPPQLQPRMTQLFQTATA